MCNNSAQTALPTQAGPGAGGILRLTDGVGTETNKSMFSHCQLPSWCVCQAFMHLRSCAGILKQSSMQRRPLRCGLSG